LVCALSATSGTPKTVGPLTLFEFRADTPPEAQVRELMPPQQLPHGRFLPPTLIPLAGCVRRLCTLGRGGPLRTQMGNLLPGGHSERPIERQASVILITGESCTRIADRVFRAKYPVTWPSEVMDS
jgi:hypothetical protein